MKGCPLNGGTCSEKCAWSLASSCRLIGVLEGIEYQLEELNNTLSGGQVKPENSAE